MPCHMLEHINVPCQHSGVLVEKATCTTNELEVIENIRMGLIA